jgi:hypothetical protein
MNRPKEFDVFTELVDRVVSVPHSVIQERVEKHRKEAEKNPRKRGPKKKAKPSSSGHGPNSRA